jgi:hypothetical protein
MISTRLAVSFCFLLASGLAPPSAWSLPVVAPTSTAVSNATAIPFGMTPAQITAAVPATASCASGVPACRTAVQMAPFINKSFSKFGFLTRGEQAAIFALMAFESGNFVFDVNVFPGRPGQGSELYILQYWCLCLTCVELMLCHPFSAKYDDVQFHPPVRAAIQPSCRPRHTTGLEFQFNSG